MITRLENFMKKKFLSLLCGIFMFVFSVFSLTSCSMVKTNTEKEYKENVLKVGDVALTKSDIISSFYTYYQNNSNYFAYYDADTIEESFYTWTVIREILNQKANSALYDAETNPNGYIFYTTDDEKTVWKSVFNYVYNQVSSYEKSNYSLAGVEEKDYPIWLKSDDSDDDESKVFEAYKSSRPDTPDADRKNKTTKKATEDFIKQNKVSELKKYLFEFVYEKGDDDGKEDVRKPMSESGYENATKNRSNAYARYIESLVTASKSTNSSIDGEKLFEDELVRVYNAYYKSQVTTLYQNYITNEELIASDLMSDKAIAKAFINQYFADKQTYQVETDYISTITSSDNKTVLLYHYKGVNYFFTVQQILVKFNDEQTNTVKALPGYSSNELDNEIAKVYRQKREELAASYDAAGAMLSEINEKSGIKSIDIIGDYYYYDDTLANEPAENYGYKKLTRTLETVDGKNIYIYRDSSNKEYKESEVKYMAAKGQILEAYKTNYQKWANIVEHYFNALVAEDINEQSQIKTNNADMESYIFETVEAMQKNGKTIENVKEKLASYLFLELEWIYSGDSLANELTNKLGYVVSNYKDQNSSWVPEFAKGARELVSKYTDAEIQSFIASGDVDKLVSSVTTDYGYHLLKVENVYKASSTDGYSLIDMNGLLTNIDENNEEYVSRIIAKMKTTYVCTSSNETVYDYFFDKLYTEYTGSNGSYFLAQEYKWLNEYYENNKIEYINKMSYSELSSKIK